MKGEIVIRKKDILQLKIEGKKLVVKQEAEKALLTLLDLKDFIDNTVEEVKKEIVKRGSEVLGEGFKGVIGEKVKAVYRTYGDKYETTNSAFTKEIVLTRTDSKKIDLYLNEKGKLPKNTNNKQRTKKLIISRINE